MTLDDTVLGELLRKARLDAGLGLRDTAARVGIPHSTLAKIESGFRPVRGVELVQIAAAVGRGVDELVTRGDAVPADVAHAAAVAAGEAAAAAIAEWITAADRAMDLAARAQLPAALSEFLPEIREVGVRAENFDTAGRMVAELSQRVIATPLPVRHAVPPSPAPPASAGDEFPGSPVTASASSHPGSGFPSPS